MKQLSFCFVLLFVMVFFLSSCTDRRQPRICDYNVYNEFSYVDTSWSRPRLHCDGFEPHSVEIDFIANDLDILNPEFLVITMGR